MDEGERFLSSLDDRFESFDFARNRLNESARRRFAGTFRSFPVRWLFAADLLTVFGV